MTLFHCRYTIEYFETIHDTDVQAASSDIPMFMLDNLKPGMQYHYTIHMRDRASDNIVWSITGNFIAAD